MVEDPSPPETFVKVVRSSLIKISSYIPSTLLLFTKIVKPSTVSLNRFSFKREGTNCNSEFLIKFL